MTAQVDTYVDEVAVERRCQGDRTVTLDRAEVGEAWRRMTARGCSARVIAETLGVSERTVVRWRSGWAVRQPHPLRRCAS